MFPFRLITTPSSCDDQTLLDALRHTGLRLIQAVNASLDTERTPDELAGLAVTFERTGRGVRRTIAFCRHLAQPARDPAKRAAARRHIIRAVEDAIERTDNSRADPDLLRTELYERLDTSEFNEELEHLTLNKPSSTSCAISASPTSPPCRPIRAAPRPTSPHSPPAPPVGPSRPCLISTPISRPPGAGDPDPATVDFILALNAGRRRAPAPSAPSTTPLDAKPDQVLS